MNDNVFLDTNVLGYSKDTAGCTVLYSEALNVDQKYANVTVVNPFTDVS